MSWFYVVTYMLAYEIAWHWLAGWQGLVSVMTRSACFEVTTLKDDYARFSWVSSCMMARRRKEDAE